MFFKKDAPVSFIYKKLKEKSKLKDCIASLVLLDPNVDPIVKEKAVAGIAIYNNPNGFFNEPQGYANSCLIFNSQYAVTDSIPAVHPMYQCYAIWELKKSFGDRPLHPEVVNYIIATLEDYDFVYPPEELSFISYHFLEKYPQAQKVSDLYENYRKNTNFLKDLENVDEFYKFHILKLIEVDAFNLSMQKIYNSYIEE